MSDPRSLLTQSLAKFGLESAHDQTLVIAFRRQLALHRAEAERELSP